MKTIGEKLKQKRLELGLTLEEIGKRTGVSRATIQRYESGVITNIPSDKIELISLALNVSPSYLMGWDQDSIAPITKWRTFPVLGVVRAGEPMFAEQNIIGYEALPAEFMKAGGEYFGLKVIGDSMNAAYIREGDIVMVRCQQDLENGEIGCVLINGENATIKKFYRTDNTVTLVPASTNPEHQIRIIDPSKVDVKILGKVVSAVTKF